MPLSKDEQRRFEQIEWALATDSEPVRRLDPEPGRRVIVGAVLLGIGVNLLQAGVVITLADAVPGALISVAGMLVVVAAIACAWF